MLGYTTKIISIGNSQGVRIPKTMLKQCHLEGEVVLEPGRDQLVVRRALGHRNGWSEAFEAMAACGDDALVISESRNTDWDDNEWEW